MMTHFQAGYCRVMLWADSAGPQGPAQSHRRDRLCSLKCRGTAKSWGRQAHQRRAASCGVSAARLCVEAAKLRAAAAAARRCCIVRQRLRCGVWRRSDGVRQSTRVRLAVCAALPSGAGIDGPRRWLHLKGAFVCAHAADSSNMCFSSRG